MAANVLVALLGLIDVSALQHLWRVSRFEFAISMVALADMLLGGILKGVLLAGFEFVGSEALCCCSWHWGLVMRRPLLLASLEPSL